LQSTSSDCQRWSIHHRPGMPYFDCSPLIYQIDQHNYR
jgi:hypothetical protein